MESPWTRDQTHVSCFGREILNHWTTREVLPTTFNQIALSQNYKEVSFKLLVLSNNQKCDAVTVLHSICQPIWKTQQWPQEWKRSVCIPIPKKGNAKECSNYRTIALISHASKVMLKILQARLQQYVN